MNPQTRKPRRAGSARQIATLLIVLALAPLLPACGPPNGTDAPIDTDTPTPGTPMTSPIPPDTTPMTEAQIVAVELLDLAIRMPASLPSGRKFFRITNRGEVPHGFAIEGQGIERRLAAPLAPGETAVLEGVELRPGGYRVYCPVADHAERGMVLQLTVV